MEETLNNIINDGNSIKQRSEEWLKYRNTRIGGSEMHNIYNLNINNVGSFINNFLFNKVDKKYDFIVPCAFGVLFENEIHSYSEMYFNCTIRETGVLQHKYISSICYSPDGLACIDDKIVLFEFKCPYSRVPSDTIKVEYKSQIETGLYTIEECDRCNYCEGEFKICKLNDLFNYSSFSGFNNYSITVDYDESYYTYGIIYLYSDKPPTAGVVDVGGLNNKYLFNNVLSMIHNKSYNVLYYSELPNKKGISIEPYNISGELPPAEDISIIRDRFEDYITNTLKKYVVGYIPWKLYNYNTIIHRRTVNFFNEDMINKLLFVGNLLKTVSLMDVPVEDKKKYLLSNKSHLENLIR